MELQYLASLHAFAVSLRLLSIVTVDSSLRDYLRWECAEMLMSSISINNCERISLPLQHLSLKRLITDGGAERKDCCTR